MPQPTRSTSATTATTPWVIDGATNTTTTVPVGAGPGDIAVNPVTQKVYVAQWGGSGVTVIDGANHTAPVPTGGLPLSLALNPLTNRIYVANYLDNSITVINGANNAVTTLRGVSSGPASVAVNPVTNTVYVANSNSDSVSRIDGATNAVISITVGRDPQAVAVDPAQNKVYVANQGDNSASVLDESVGTVASMFADGGPTALAVNPSTGQVGILGIQGSMMVVEPDGSTSSFPVGTAPLALAANPVNSKFYVPNFGSNIVSVIDDPRYARALSPTLPNGGTNLALSSMTGTPYFTAIQNNVTVVAVMNTHSCGITTIPEAGLYPETVAVNPSTNKIYVTQYNSGIVAMINGATGRVAKTWTIGSYTCDVAVNPATDQVYVTDYGSYQVAVLDGLTDSKIATLPTGKGPCAVKVNPATNMAYVGNYDGNSVTIVNGTSNTFAATVPVGSQPIDIAVSVPRSLIYVANNGSSSVSVIDGAINTVATTLAVGGEPYALVSNPVDGRAYAASQASNRLTMIDGTTILRTVALPVNPQDVSVDPGTNRVYVPGFSVAHNPDGTYTETNVLGELDVTTGKFSSYPDVATALAVAVDPITHAVYTAAQFDRNYNGKGIHTFAPSAPELVPLNVSIAPLPGNRTASAAPVVTLNAGSTFIPNTLPVRGVYYQLDTRSGAWKPAAKTASGWKAALSGLRNGSHILYAFASDGQESTGGNTGPDSSGLIGKVAAYPFVKGP